MTEGTTTAVAADPYFVNPGVGNAGAWDDATKVARESLLGTLKNKGWDQKSPLEALHEAVKSYNEVEKHLGIPREQIVRLPKDPSDKDGWAAFNKRIGVPEKAEEYDFSKVKFSDGTELDDGFVNTMRTILHARGIPMSNAVDLVSDIVKYMESVDTDEAAAHQAATAQGRDALAKSWGPRMEANMFIAKQAAVKLGLSEDFVNKLENEIGYEPTMQQMLKLGQMMGEDRFVSNNEGPAKGVLTREQAQSRLDELKRDAAWVGKVNNGDHKANEEFSALTRIISMGG